MLSGVELACHAGCERLQPSSVRRGARGLVYYTSRSVTEGGSCRVPGVTANCNGPGACPTAEAALHLDAPLEWCFDLRRGSPHLAARTATLTYGATGKRAKVGSEA